MMCHSRFVCLAVMLGLGSARGSAPILPAINTNNIIIVTNAAYGAVGDGVFTNTTAFQNAINAVTVGGLTNGLRGGMVQVPAGTFLCGPLTMKNNVQLQLDAGAVVRLLDYNSYPGSPTNVVPFISGSGLTNIAVTGLGMINGQGSPWWLGYKTNSRPVILYLPGCSQVLLQNFTITNPPTAHIAIKGANAGNINVIGVKLFAPDSSDPVNPSHNTDGVDFAETNALFQDCVISTGDDNIAIGSSGSVSKDIMVTNCSFGYGHGLSIGSFTSGGVSNLTVVSCSFSNTGTGIKIKSERNRGGVVQNCNYYNLTMTNVPAPIQFYAYYEYGIGTLETMDVNFAAYVAYTTTNPVPYNPPIYRNITISNLTANVPSGQPPLMIWGLPDYPASNIVLQNVNITSSSMTAPQIYNVTNVQFINCSFSEPAGVKTFQLWDADVTFTNSALGTNLLLLTGLTTNGVGNWLEFDNANATVSNTNAIAGGALTISASTLTISNNLAMTASNSFNFILGTNAATVLVKGNLILGGTNNIYAGKGFTNGAYTLMTYTGVLGGSLPVLGTTPIGFVCTLNTNTAGQVKLVVTPPPPGIPTNLTALGTNLMINLNWLAAANATGYNLLRSTTNGGPYAYISNLASTNYSDAIKNPGRVYYYVVTATNTAGTSGYSSQVMAAALPSLLATNLNFQVAGNQMQFSWPVDHTGWRLQAQTNNLDVGLNTNWTTVANSTGTNQINLPMNPTDGSVFYRLVYP